MNPPYATSLLQLRTLSDHAIMMLPGKTTQRPISQQHLESGGFGIPVSASQGENEASHGNPIDWAYMLNCTYVW